jgi:hypothetical protein
VLTGERRTALLAWLRASDAIAIEDEYDAEYRYDRAAIGALQGLDPDRVIYAGSASKTLAPALGIGWLVVPPSRLQAVSHEKLLADRGTARIEQHAFADFLTRGELDRHLRRMRARYRSRSERRPTTGASSLRRWPTTDPTPAGAPQSSCSATRKCPSPPSAPESTSSPKQYEQQEPAPARPAAPEPPSQANSVESQPISARNLHGPEARPDGRRVV